MLDHGRWRRRRDQIVERAGVSALRHRIGVAIASSDWAEVRAIAGRLRDGGDLGSLPIRQQRYALSAGALHAGMKEVGPVLAARLPEKAGGALRLEGGFEDQQGLQNAGGLLNWRLLDADGQCRFAAMEKIFPRPWASGAGQGGRGAYGAEWLREAYFYRGLRPVTPDPGCHVPAFLGMRHGPGWIGLLTADLRPDGWRSLQAWDVAAHQTTVIRGLADFALDYRLAPPASGARWSAPAYRPFFARLTPQKYEVFGQALALAGVEPQELAGILDAVWRLDRGWAGLTAAPGAPEVLCHGDPHFRNCLVDDDGRFALVDMENYVFGAVGMDAGRFVGSGVTRRMEAGLAPGALPEARADAGGLQSGKALEAGLEQAVGDYVARLSERGVTVAEHDVRCIARRSAAMSIVFAATVWRRMAEQSPDYVRPAFSVLSRWLSA